MAISSSFPSLRVRKYGDPVLRRKAKPVEKFDEELAQLVRKMFKTMYDEPGIGLAAPQVGVSTRLLVADVAQGGKPNPVVLINPRLEETKGRVISEEGCLSFPGIQVHIPRHQWVKVTGLNEKGLPVMITAEGILSRCLQHEMDHLDGVLMVDHVPWPERLKVFWNIRKKKKAGLW